MKHTMRRSWLLTPVTNPEKLALAINGAADVVVLDLVEFVAESNKPAAREHMPAALSAVAKTGKQVFAQVDPELLYADLHASVWPGLAGIVISRAETLAHVAEADQLLTSLEQERAMPAGSVEIVIACETARGNHAAFDLACASKRVSGLTLGRADLIMDLRPEPSGEIHLMQYLMQRVILIAGAANVISIGAWWRAPDRGLLATPERTLEAAQRGRAIGFRGAMCLSADQVEPLNCGFTPSAAEEAAARQVLAAYDAAVAHGSGVARQGDVLIERGAARQAQHVLDLGAQCAPLSSLARSQ